MVQQSRNGDHYLQFSHGCEPTTLKIIAEAQKGKKTRIRSFAPTAHLQHDKTTKLNHVNEDSTTWQCVEQLAPKIRTETKHHLTCAGRWGSRWRCCTRRRFRRSYGACTPPSTSPRRAVNDAAAWRNRPAMPVHPEESVSGSWSTG
jgi:hypothetical protein